MEVRTEHRVDAGKKDARGLYDYYYAYTNFFFSEADAVLHCRVYDGTPTEASFPSVHGSLIESPLFRAAVDYLRRKKGIAMIRVSDPVNGGYVTLPEFG